MNIHYIEHFACSSEPTVSLLIFQVALFHAGVHVEKRDASLGVLLEMEPLAKGWEGRTASTGNREAAMGVADDE